jgi:hypothetical protein
MSKIVWYVGDDILHIEKNKITKDENTKDNKIKK